MKDGLSIFFCVFEIRSTFSEGSGDAMRGSFSRLGILKIMPSLVLVLTFFVVLDEVQRES